MSTSNTRNRSMDAPVAPGSRWRRESRLAAAYLALAFVLGLLSALTATAAAPGMQP